MTRREYPAAARVDVVDDMHGRRVPDPYRWLEEPADPRTRAWLAAQGELFRRAQASWAGGDRLGHRFVELTAGGRMSLPRPRDRRVFYTHRRPDQDHPVLMVREPDGTERPLLDPVVVDPTGSTTLEHWRPSVGGDLLAYQVAGGGTEAALLRVLDVDTGRVVDGPIDRVRRTPVAWLPDGTGFYYVRRLHPDLVPPGESQYHRRVYLHRLGTAPADDVLIFGDGRGKTDYYDVALSIDGRWLTVSATAGTERRTDLWLADLRATGPDRPHFRVVQAGVEARTIPYVRGGTGPADPIYLITDRDAPRGRVAVTAPDRPDVWTELVAEDPEAVLADIAVLDGPEMAPPVLLAVRNRHAVSEITVHRLADGRPLATVALPGPGAITHIVDRLEGGHEAWFMYTDFTHPHGVYRYDGLTRRVHRWDTLPHPQPPPVQTRPVAYPSTGGATVRMLVLSAAGYPDRPRPTVITGYGGFGVSTPADYSPMPLAWVEAGGVWAVAHVRGGGEEGTAWHRAGMRENQQHSIDDLHAAAEWLVGNGWTTPARLGLYGGSNSGLLVAAALTQRPQLYAAVVSSAPLLDMARYELSGLGPSWVAEYGTAADPEQLDWLLSYSPYHNVREGTAYPAVLFTVFDGDTRVDPLHARKMCAALQYATSSDRPVLIRTEGAVGHSYRAVSRGIGVLADSLAFLAAELGLCLPARDPEPGSLPFASAARGYSSRSTSRT
jgi:prolyl oligopeptidase